MLETQRPPAGDRRAVGLECAAASGEFPVPLVAQTHHEINWRSVGAVALGVFARLDRIRLDHAV
jgi:hypothetical protein